MIEQLTSESQIFRYVYLALLLIPPILLVWYTRVILRMMDTALVGLRESIAHSTHELKTEIGLSVQVANLETRLGQMEGQIHNLTVTIQTARAPPTL